MKKAEAYSLGSVVCSLFSCGSAYGADIAACTALDASVSVDLVLSVALRDSAYGALISTSAAGNAIVRNLISHN